MATKPENTFIQSVHKYIKNKIHIEKMCNPYRAGIADVWYSGARDMWIEYKFINSIPKKALIYPNLSEIQREWLNARCDEGRIVAVILGCKEGGVIYFHKSWNIGIDNKAFRERLLTRKELADRIITTIGVNNAPAYSNDIYSGKNSNCGSPIGSCNDNNTSSS